MSKQHQISTASESAISGPTDDKHAKLFRQFDMNVIASETDTKGIITSTFAHKFQ